MVKKYTAIFKSEKFRSLLKNHKVKRIAIFGSYARGTALKTSDMDFLVEFEKDADLLDQVGLKFDLEKLFKKEVDIATPRSLSKYIRHKVIKDAETIYAQG